ncbi:MAG: hypothetical protein Q8N79_04465, partial [Candidatus Methanoperedens sp.]|nr:hypothetical protein [Candidatus Methanoperedens sp.]
PVMVMKEAPSSSAADALKKLKAKATSTDLSSAILLGRRMLPEGGRIVVLSDFTSFIGDDPAVAKKLAEANGINTEFVTISGRTDNTGIVNGWFEGSDYKVTVKNFNKDAQQVKIDVFTDNKNVLSSTLNLNAQSSEYFGISNLAPGTTKISLDVQDALAVDNSAFVIKPKSPKQDILFIPDNVKLPSFKALDTISSQYSSITIKRADIKSIPSLSGYSIVFVSAPLSPEAAKTLSDYISSGGNAVIITSPEVKDTEFLPVELGALSTRCLQGCQNLNVIQPSRITEGISMEKIEVKRHFKARLKRGAISLVEGGDRSSLLSYWKYGKGTVVYSGLSDPRGDNIFDPLDDNNWNDFHSQPQYPLFWKQMLEWISGSHDVSEYNAKTGMFIKLPASQTVKTPSDSITTELLLLDEVGVYELPGKDVAVNLYDERESNLAGSISEIPPSVEKEIPYTVQTIRKPKYLDTYLIMAAMFFVFFELYYLRWRGEL